VTEGSGEEGTEWLTPPLGGYNSSWKEISMLKLKFVGG